MHIHQSTARLVIMKEIAGLGIDVAECAKNQAVFGFLDLNLNRVSSILMH